MAYRQICERAEYRARRRPSFRASDVDSRGVKHVLDVRSIVFLDHLNAGARVALAVMLHAEFVEERIEQLALNFREQELVRFKAVGSFIRLNGCTAPGMVLQ